MKTSIIFRILTMAAGSLLAADSGPKDEITAAAKKLEQKDNYSWKSTMDFGNFSTTTEGKIDKDGLLSKYELEQQGTVSFGGDERDIDGTTTVEIKEVGTTKVEVPEAATKKLS